MVLPLSSEVGVYRPSPAVKPYITSVRICIFIGALLSLMRLVIFPYFRFMEMWLLDVIHGLILVLGGIYLCKGLNVAS